MLLVRSILIACGLFFLQSSAYELEACQGGTGKCVLVTTCPSAVALLKKKIQHNYPRCGWSGRNEVVCCPDKDLPDGTDARSPSNLKSRAACQNYSNAMGMGGVTALIIGGEEAELGEFPHMAALGYPSEQSDDIEWGSCGGCLISYDYVLTAAHCLVRSDQKEPTVVRLGKVDLQGNTDGAVAFDFQVSDKIIHPGYNISAKVNDIALIRIEKPVVISKNIAPACLYTKPSNPNKFSIIGWGLISTTGSGSPILLKTEVKSVELDACNQAFNVPPFPRTIFASQLCAKSNDSVPRDTCQGDSGGPAQIRENPKESVLYSVIGITSFGRSCGGNITPSIYTRVSSYIAWIEKIVWP